MLTTVTDPSTALDSSASPTVSVIICSYTQQRWEGLLEAVASVGVQTHPALETIVVIDHDAGLLERATATLVGRPSPREPW